MGIASPLTISCRWDDQLCGSWRSGIQGLACSFELHHGSWALAQTTERQQCWPHAQGNDDAVTGFLCTLQSTWCQHCWNKLHKKMCTVHKTHRKSWELSFSVKGQPVSSLGKSCQYRYAYIDCAAVHYAPVGWETVAEKQCNLLCKVRLSPQVSGMLTDWVVQKCGCSRMPLPLTMSARWGIAPSCAARTVLMISKGASI